MPIIQTPGAQRRLQQAYGLLGEPPAPTLSPEIVPVTVVDNLGLGAGATGAGGGPAPGAVIPPQDTGVLASTAYERSIQAVAVAGQYSTVTFYNPRNSNVLAMISHLSGTAQADGSIFSTIFSSHILASPTIGADRGYQRDLRNVPPGVDPYLNLRSQCGMFEASTPAAPIVDRGNTVKIASGNNGYATNTPAESRFAGFIFRPNSGITFQFSILNTQWSLDLIWLERQLLDGEPNGT